MPERAITRRGPLAAYHGHQMVCLGTTKAGAPRHPLYVKGDQPFVPFGNGRSDGS